MITKERLEELIKQGATIWHYEWEEIKLNKYTCEICEVKSLLFHKHIGWALQFEYSYNDTTYKGEVDINELEEDVEKGKWEEEFGNITRTETLKLPTWEEFQQSKDIVFHNRDSEYSLYLNKEGKNKVMIRIWQERINSEYGVCIWGERATKENYTLACRKCKELFLGEKDE